MFEEIYKPPFQSISDIKWNDDDPAAYDRQLFELGEGHDRFLILNPNNDDKELIHYVEEIPDTTKCVVFFYENNWIGKLFHKDWAGDWNSYIEVEVTKPKFIWKRNPSLDKLMTFEDNPYGTYFPDPWKYKYKLVWYMDPRVNPLEEKVWAMSCEPYGKISLGEKDMGYVMPQIDVEYSEHLPALAIDVNECYPAFYHLDHECAYNLDPVHGADDELWVIKFSPRYRKPRSWKWYGTVSPQVRIEYNPDLGELDYDLEYTVPWHDLGFEHVWMLDKAHMHEGEEEIWAFKFRTSDEVEGVKIMDYISPTTYIEYNPALDGMRFKLDYVIPWHDVSYSHVWYIEIEGEKVWAAKQQAVSKTRKVKDMGTIQPILPEHLSVIFISYNEPDAEKNWQRVLEKAPWAKRVDGVKGIFNAHKAAAKLSDTDMFYVVDGDAWLTDDWNFDFQPRLYDRNCAFIWYSQNPINDLVYGYGGVKLFAKSRVLNAKKWNTLDFATTIMSKLKVVEQVSNVSMFNTDEFSTWRSAFRECVKLKSNLVANNNSQEDLDRLQTWLTTGADKPFGKFAVEAARQAVEFFDSNPEHETQMQINDRAWLLKKFQSIYQK